MAWLSRNDAVQGFSLVTGQSFADRLSAKFMSSTVVKQTPQATMIVDLVLVRAFCSIQWQHACKTLFKHNTTFYKIVNHKHKVYFTF